MRACVLVVVLASLAFAPAPFPRPARRGAEQDDMTRMQGTWTVVESYYNGRNQPTSHTHIVLRGTNWKFMRGESLNSDWEISLDPTTSPRSLNFLQGKGPGVSLPSVYRFDGDTLRIVYAAGKRPVEADLQGREHWLLVMRRGGR